MAPDPSPPPPPPSKTPKATTEEPPEYDGIAADAVFNTAELIEKILVDVPLKTLLTSQRVSKQWKATIAGSKEIQKKLFFTPAVAKRAFRKFEYLDDEYADDEECMFDYWFRTYAVESVALDTVEPGMRVALQASLNPLFKVTSTFDSDSHPHNRADCGELIVVASKDLLAFITQTAKYSNSFLEPSYLDMFLCQPPANAVKLRCGGRIIVVRRQMGLRIRDIVEMCDKMSQEFETEGHGDSSCIFLPRAEMFDIKLAGVAFHQELGDALLFCTTEDYGVEDPSTKKGVIYKD
ncbi:hypothetical protein M409DRAFT_27471 [Zasmidium cellare ATCC 36951]|uniref:F-box domain-containing protein n=1 Tax=Zasmidium cellare ATCC 36951 TaxID=1080233 RepID=A0A6A6C4N8_ZASCE|nr:uncharacterized protein M409DRAFT_27471 [Zasmidium cellare ATCC 36951]KAF2162094.1 hypothetical protein M409DRAFT_27471 [Zasmidium cellare ATCC 36951]